MLSCLIPLPNTDPPSHGKRPPRTKTLQADVASMTAAFSILTYNMHAGMDGDQVLRLESQAMDLACVGANLVCLQEADVRTYRSGRVDQVERLARIAGYPYHVFGAAMSHDGGLYGNAVLSTWPILASVSVPFRAVQDVPVTHVDGKTRPWPEKAEPRSVLLARVRTPNGDLLVVSGHFSIFPAERLVAARDLISILPEGPTIAGFDLNNGDPGSPEREALLSVFDDLSVGFPAYQAATFPADAPAHAIDVLLGREVHALDVVLVEGTATDHLGLYAEFLLQH